MHVCLCTHMWMYACVYEKLTHNLTTHKHLPLTVDNLHFRHLSTNMYIYTSL